MKLTFISDTHSLHHQLPALGSGDILIHCGDFTGRGTLDDTEDFAAYLSQQDFTHKIVIAGNHDKCFEDHRQRQAEACLHKHNIIYLNDSGIEIDGVHFWGSPIQPEFFNWSFQRNRGQDIRRHWAMIPGNTDVLLTHGPPFGKLDLCDHGGRAGCEDLLEIVEALQPKIHAFGHIHEDYGMLDRGATTFINACNLDARYRMRNPPIEVSL